MEHLLEEVDLLADILAATTSLKILATSREALHLQEEWLKPITGLTYPHEKEYISFPIQRIAFSSRNDQSLHRAVFPFFPQLSR